MTNTKYGVALLAGMIVLAAVLMGCVDTNAFNEKPRGSSEIAGIWVDNSGNYYKYVPSYPNATVGTAYVQCKGMCYIEGPEEWVQMAEYKYVGNGEYSLDFEIRGEPLVRHVVEGDTMFQKGSRKDPNFRGPASIRATEDEAHADWLKETNQG